MARSGPRRKRLPQHFGNGLRGAPPVGQRVFTTGDGSHQPSSDPVESASVATANPLGHKQFAKEVRLATEGASPRQSVQDKRQPAIVFSEPTPGKTFLARFMARYLRGLMLRDIIGTQHHSDDFVETRADYIALRLRFLLAFYAIAIPAWMPFDCLLLSPEHAAALVVPRLAMSAFLVLLAGLTLRAPTSRQVHLVLALTFLASGAFYFVTMQILDHGAVEASLAGYNLMPLLIVSMLGVFPLTLDWGIALIALSTIPYLALAATQGRLMTADTANMLWMLLMLGGIALWVQASQLLMLLRLYRESTQDPLTGLINRRALMKRLTIEMAHLEEGRIPFSILMFDLDRFKRINDNYGHLIGDKVLKATAATLQSGLRAHDIVARFGGEEFVAVLPSCGSEEALAIAERIRASCHATELTAPNGDIIRLSTSIGVTEYEPGEAIDATLNRVDESLYKAKELGRNRVVHSQSQD